MGKRIFFITGTDTGVGKTVFAAMFTRHLREKGIDVAALKPLCSGGREDARLLRAAAGNILSLDQINPWHFRAPLAPLLAARKEGKRVELDHVTQQIKLFQKQFETLVVEGAGGLLSPLGENFDSRDLLIALSATPILICANRLGAINQVLLVRDALRKRAVKGLQIILMSPRCANAVTRSNVQLLAELTEPSRLHLFPWIANFDAPLPRAAQNTLDIVRNA